MSKPFRAPDEDVVQLPVDEALRSLVDSLIASFDAETGQWHPSWSSAGLLPHNATTGINYRGINTVILWAAQLKLGYSSPRWATYKQWRDVDAQVRRNSHGVRCVKWVTLGNVDADPDDGPGKLVPRVFTVFNVDQVDNAPEDPAAALALDVDWWDHFDQFLDAIPVTITVGSPCYVPQVDTVMCPQRASFESAEAYATTLCHELGHWSGHPTRLDRQRPDKYSGIEAYAYEELVAEICSALTAGWLQIPAAPTRTDHVQYVKGWLASLHDDPRILLSAALAAQRATDYLVAFSSAGVQCPAA